MSDNSDSEAEKLFAQYGKGHSKFQDVSQSGSSEGQERTAKKKNRSKQKNIKKKSKKSKKMKEKKKISSYEDESQESSGRPDIADLIESMAEEDSQEEQQSFNESGQEIAQHDKQYYNELYGLNKKRATEQYLAKFDNKGEQEINKMYQKKVHAAKKNAVVTHTAKDPEVYMAACFNGQEEALALALVNKANYCHAHPGHYYCRLISAFASRKKFPGKIFIEANSEKDAKDSLEGLTAVMSESVKQVDYQAYGSIFQASVQRKAAFKAGELVRIKKGLYTGDLGKIHKIYKHRIDILVVPRLGMQLIREEMRKVESTFPETQQILKKNQIFKKYTGTKLCFDSLSKRPSKAVLPDNAFDDFRQLPQNKKITLTPQGLMILGFAPFEIGTPEGTILPIELEPFSKEGNIIEQFKDADKIHVRAAWKVGEQASVSVGELKGCYGKIIEILGNIATIKCHNKQIKHVIIEEIVDHLQKKFAVGQRVLVVEGRSKGTEGLIIREEGPTITIWTDNNNELKVSALNLQLKTVDMQSGSNILGLKQEQLIKTIRGNVVIITAVSKDALRVMDDLNMESVISNIEYKTKITVFNVSAKSKLGEVIERECMVKISTGERRGLVCEVKRIYQNYLYLYGCELRKSQGYCVQKADNCLLVTKNIRVSKRT